MDKSVFKNRILIIFLTLICTTHVEANPIILKNAVESTTFFKPDAKATEFSTIKSRHQHEKIVLLHGLMRTSLSMAPLKSYLENQGYQVYSYSYPSTRYTIHEHGIYLNQYIEHLLAKNPDITLHFITHSLGGIIAREAISILPQNKLKHVGSLIMLAPPNQGSTLAKLSIKIAPIITSLIKPLAELSSEHSSYVHRVPLPKIRMGIIAGRFDAKVPPSAAYLKGGTELVVINSTHTFIMNHAKTKKLIMNFLEKGSFESEEKG